ncbi:MAG: hypothetical protein ABJ308_06965 [Halieaceae bacterium]
MKTRDGLEYRYLQFPENLSEAEKLDVLERARYEAFSKGGLVGKSTLFDVLVSVSAISITVALSAGILLSGYISDENYLLRPLLVAVVLGLALYWSSLIKQVHRAKILNPIICELLAEQHSQKG